MSNKSDNKPVAWQWMDTGHFRKKIPASAMNPADWRPLYAAPVAQWEPVAWLYDYTDSDGDCRTSATHRDPRVIYAHELHRVTNIRPLGEIAAPAAPVAQPLACAPGKPNVVYVDGFGYVDERAVRAIERAHGISQGADDA